MRGRRGVRVLEAAGVGHEADVQRPRRALGQRNARLVEQARDDLGGAGCVGDDEVDGAEERVVVVVVDVDDARELPGDLAAAVDPLRRAAIERDQRAPRRIGGHAPPDAIESEEREFTRERVIAVLEQHDVATVGRQRQPEAEQRSQRVTVRRGMRADADRICPAQDVEHLGAAHVSSSPAASGRAAGSASGSGM